MDPNSQNHHAPSYFIQVGFQNDRMTQPSIGLHSDLQPVGPAANYGYPLLNVQTAIEHGPFIGSFPIENVYFP